MQYQTVKEGRFLSRPNRFIAHVLVDGAEEVVHVKNTGRCRELLLPGAAVDLEEGRSPHRKTRYDPVSYTHRLVARGPVSASPSPTVTAAIRSGLSNTAPKAWAME